MPEILSQVSCAPSKGSKGYTPVQWSWPFYVIDSRAGLGHEPLDKQCGVDNGQDLLVHLVFFQHMEWTWAFATQKNLTRLSRNSV